MKFEIKDRCDFRTLFSLETETFKACVKAAVHNGADLCGADLCGADLCGADLCGANLCGANLCGADLCGANLCGADLCGANIDGEIIQRPPISVANITYWCLITDNRMRLGCKLHTHNEWQNFNDGEISAMDDDALDFWKTWKEPLLAMCAAHRSKL